MGCLGTMRPNNLQARRPEVDLACVRIDTKRPSTEAPRRIIVAEGLTDPKTVVDELNVAITEDAKTTLLRRKGLDIISDASNGSSGKGCDPVRVGCDCTAKIKLKIAGSRRDDRSGQDEAEKGGDVESHDVVSMPAADLLQSNRSRE